MATKNYIPDISYFKGMLLLNIEENYPEKAFDIDFIEEQTTLAEESYEYNIRDGKIPIEAEEIAKVVLFRRLGFSKINTIKTILYTEFEDYADWDKDMGTAYKLMLRLDSVFEKYTLTDEFEESEEFEHLYNELIGTINIIFKEDGI